MNIDLLKINERNVFNEYFDSMISHGFSPCITLPTRFSKRSATLIDNFLLKFSEKYGDTSSCILFSAISDHLPYFVCLRTKNSINQVTRSIEIKPTRESLDNFRHEISNGEMYNLLDKNINADPNNNYNIVHDTIHKARIRHLSTKKVKFNKHKHKKNDWITLGIIKSIKFCDNLYKTLKSTQIDTPEHANIKTNVQTYNKIIKKNIRLAKKLYYHQLFEKKKFDMKNTWKIIKEALGKLENKNKFPDHFKFKGKLITDKYVIANNFNNFFINIGPTLSSKIKPDSKASYKDFLKNKTNYVFNFQTIDRTSVLKTIDDLPNKASCGFDNLSLKLIKSIKFDILDSLTLIINQSLMSGVFPDKLKLAKVIPLYKKGDSTITDNYRPNSLLPTLSKVLEKIAYNQLFAYFSNKELFYPSQYGFRRGHSTELAARELIDLIIQKLDAGKLPLAIFFRSVKGL